MKIGYARVSTSDQNLNLQIDALKEIGCEKIFTDVTSGTKKDRLGLEETLNYSREGDIIVVWKLDRVGRSLKNLIEIINSLNSRHVGFVSIKENIDTTSSSGRLMFHIFASLAEFERDIIKERTQAGLKAARARGRLGGRPKKLDNKQASIAKTMMKDKSISINDICKTFNISKSTLYKTINELA